MNPIIFDVEIVKDKQVISKIKKKGGRERWNKEKESGESTKGSIVKKRKKGR